MQQVRAEFRDGCRAFERHVTRDPCRAPVSGDALLVLSAVTAKLAPMLDAPPNPSAEAAVLPDDSFRQHRALLTDMARKYVWWMSPEEALDYPARIVAQVMNIGVFRDASRVAETLGDDCLRNIVKTAEAGWFNDRSWHYWNYRLGLAAVDHVPPLPVRRFA